MLVPLDSPAYRSNMKNPAAAAIATYQSNVGSTPGDPRNSDNLSTALRKLEALSQELNTRSVMEVVYVGSPHQQLTETDRQIVTRLLETTDGAEGEYRADLTTLLSEGATTYDAAVVFARHRATSKDEQVLPVGYAVQTAEEELGIQHTETGQLVELGTTEAGQRVRVLRADMPIDNTAATIAVTKFVAAANETEGHSEPTVVITKGDPRLMVDFMQVSLDTGHQLGISTPGQRRFAEARGVEFQKLELPRDVAQAILREHYHRLKAFAQAFDAQQQ
jgi:hypothetical protein